MDIELFPTLAALLTSLAMCWLGRRSGLSPGTLRTALAKAFEFLGLWMLVTTTNVLVATLLVLGTRLLTRRSASLYVLTEPLIAFSLVQALVLWIGRDTIRRVKTG